MGSHWNRTVLGGKETSAVAEVLQGCLTDLVDLGLVLKQAHWTVQGERFRNIHLHLDEIIAAVRGASDEVAERVSTLGVAPDGRAATVAQDSRLEVYPPGFSGGRDTVRLCADRCAAVIKGLRKAIGDVGDHDKVSEDLLIGISADLEKHLWMLQAQEKE